MSTNQSICYHDYPKLEKNMVSTVRCHHIRNDDNSNAFLYKFLSTILTEVDHRQMLSCMGSQVQKKKRKKNTSAKGRIVETLVQLSDATLQLHYFVTDLTVPTEFPHHQKPNSFAIWFLSFILNKLYSLLLLCFLFLVFIFTSLSKEDFTTFKCKSCKAISLSANIYGDDMN